MRGEQETLKRAEYFWEYDANLSLVGKSIPNFSHFKKKKQSKMECCKQESSKHQRHCDDA